MTADRLPESKLCACPKERCYRLVSPLGGLCGGCVTGTEHYTFGASVPAHAYVHRERRKVVLS
jgi:hypothetical protein